MTLSIQADFKTGKYECPNCGKQMPMCYENKRGEQYLGAASANAQKHVIACHAKAVKSQPLCKHAEINENKYINKVGSVICCKLKDGSFPKL